WDTLLEWAGRHNLLSRPHRFFGYNNPDPSPGSPNYGYDQWITVGPEIQAEGAIKLKELPGGLYAVARCGVQNIPPTWKQLVVWCEASKYHMAHHQWLEECLTPMTPGSLPLEQMQFDLYLPIVE
ncbi:MAG TPA: effector binding domain-containing protein, partial [Anaerolineae bacterium]